MKKLGFFALMIASWLHGCPTCVGKITHTSPPFFSNNFYEVQPQDQDSQERIEETQDEENEDLMGDMEE